MIVDAGIDVAFEAGIVLSAHDEMVLLDFRRDGVSRSSSFTFGTSARLTPDRKLAALPIEETASLRWDDSRLTILHRNFIAEIDPAARRGLLHREETGGLSAILRATLLTQLTYDGGLPLHAAAVVIEGSAYIFFGVSESGKSTIARSAPFPILSDELVAVHREGDTFYASRTGFWSDARRESAPSGRFEVRGLFELHKGAFRVERLSPIAAAQKLTLVAQFPPSDELWRRGLDSITDLVRTTPAYMLRWSQGEPPWESLRELGIV